MIKAPAVAALSALLFVVATAGAEAATYDGTTSQGKTAKVVTESDGYMKTATVFWSAPCGSGTNQEGSTEFPSDFSNTTEDGSLISGTYTDDPGAGLTRRITTEFRGVPAGLTGWRGTFVATIELLSGETVVDRCSVAPETFTAGIAAPAGPAKSFVGTTSQKWIATLNTRTDGVVARVRVAWRAKCDNGTVYERSTVFNNDLKTKSGVRNAGSYQDRKGTGKHKGERYKVAISLEGKRSMVGGAERWSGTFKGSVAESKRGKVFTRCQIKRTRWTVDPL